MIWTFVSGYRHKYGHFFYGQSRVEFQWVQKSEFSIYYQNMSMSVINSVLFLNIFPHKIEFMVVFLFYPFTSAVPNSIRLVFHFNLKAELNFECLRSFPFGVGSFSRSADALQKKGQWKSFRNENFNRHGW